MILAYVETTNERLIAPQYDANFCPSSIFLHKTCTVWH